MEMRLVERRSYDWFEKRRRTKGLELAHEQITKAFDTVTLLHKAMKSFSEGNLKETRKYTENQFTAEEEVDKLRTMVFTELSKGAALVADYREDLLHLVKRLDTLADHTKDAARCLQMLGEAKIPEELCEKTLYMTLILSILRRRAYSLSTAKKSTAEPWSYSTI